MVLSLRIDCQRNHQRNRKENITNIIQSVVKIPFIYLKFKLFYYQLHPKPLLLFKISITSGTRIIKL